MLEYMSFKNYADVRNNVQMYLSLKLFTSTDLRKKYRTFLKLKLLTRFF